MAYSLSQAFDLLTTTDLTPQALANLAKQVSIEASGAVTVLYGGKLPDGTSASDAITAMVRNGDDIRVIDKSSTLNNPAKPHEHRRAGGLRPFANSHFNFP